MSAESPISWRVSWFYATTRPPFRRGPEYALFPTEVEARRVLERIKAVDADAVGCVVPVWPNPPDPTSKAAKRRALEELGMPVQLSPKALTRTAKR